MKITQFTDYSFRLLLYLARSPGRVVTVREVAEHYGISAEHLKKIVRSLSDLGHVQTVRGKLGGLKMARDPSEINLGQLVRAQENLNLLPCHEPCDLCPMQTCKLRDLVDEALDSFLGFFDAKTLADII
ncbi:transcriptional regulator [Paramagnetospirillum kuznetsovii]|uniref:Transcriptional regulator n=1 Tax=Paramagnetospirillum kuznetsovii TaxID=2053833 RepID=A0A364NTS0_9PROT|nr:Rrf2 family transcriptional regulator [Paramagnetospirillum kuznetsovii]RAU20400.1 transcriptional regulator [Paramagnetospirillum kuznetsovii]